MNNFKEGKNKEIKIPKISNDPSLNNLIKKLSSLNGLINGKNGENGVMNNHNFLMLLEMNILKINLRNLNGIEINFLFQFLIDIHSKRFIVLKLDFQKDIKEKELLENFLKNIENKLKEFGKDYDNEIKKLDGVIIQIKKSYLNILKTEDSEILGTLIIDIISEIGSFKLSLLNENNLSFLNELSIHFKIKLKEILESGKNVIETIIIEEKILELTEFEKITSLNNKIISEETSSIRKKSIIYLIEKFKFKIKNEKDMVLLGNEYTETFLKLIEQFPEDFNFGELKEEIGFVILNILDTRELTTELKLKHKDFLNKKINKEFAKRREKLYFIFK